MFNDEDLEGDHSDYGIVLFFIMLVMVPLLVAFFFWLIKG